MHFFNNSNLKPFYRKNLFLYTISDILGDFFLKEGIMTEIFEMLTLKKVSF